MAANVASRRKVSHGGKPQVSWMGKRQFEYFTELTLDGKMRIILCCSPCKLMENFTAREVQ